EAADHHAARGRRRDRPGVADAARKARDDEVRAAAGAADHDAAADARDRDEAAVADAARELTDRDRAGGAGETPDQDAVLGRVDRAGVGDAAVEGRDRHPRAQHIGATDEDADAVAGLRRDDP